MAEVSEERETAKEHENEEDRDDEQREMRPAEDQAGQSHAVAIDRARRRAADFACARCGRE